VFSTFRFVPRRSVIIVRREDRENDDQIDGPWLYPGCCRLIIYCWQQRHTGIDQVATRGPDNAAAPSRTTVRIPTASGDELEAWLYLPEGDGPHPAVVMAHGIGAIKAGGLAPFAERFCGQ
jgi:hypothetical protein